MKYRFNMRQDMSKPISVDGLRTPEDLLQAETPETALENMRKNTKNRAVLPEMLSINEASARTNLSYEFLRYLCYSKKVNSIKCGRKYMIDSSSLAEFIKNGGAEE